MKPFPLRRRLLAGALTAGLVPLAVVLVSSPASAASYEAESTANTLIGRAGVRDCAGCSGAKKVGDVYGGGALEFRGVSAAAAGGFRLRIHYTAGDARSAQVSVNGGTAGTVSFASTGGWNTVGIQELTVPLAAGSNVIRIDSGTGYGPDLDSIEIDPLPSATSYEAESAANTLAGGAATASCGACSGGAKVGYIGGTGTLRFNTVTAPATADYRLRISYATADQRQATVTVNSAAGVPVTFAPSGGWDKVATTELTVRLTAGGNTVTLANPSGYAPDIDRIELTASGSTPSPTPTPTPTATPTPGGGVDIAAGNIRINYSLTTGRADVYYSGVRRITGMYSGADVGSAFVSTKDAGASCSYASLTVTCTRPGQPTLRQRFTFDGPDHFLIQLEASSSSAVSTNRMIPMLVDTAGGVDLGVTGDNRVLLVPVDNDAWVRYEAKPVDTVTTAHRSFEVTSFYDDASRAGFVFGSVDHDTWKSATVAAGGSGKLNRLEVTAGLTDYQYDYGSADNRYQFNREERAHRALSGTTVSSPRMLIGYYSDWRAGMETFARTNARVVPSRTWNKGVPFGFNSWGGLGARVADPNLMTQTSDFLADQVPAWRNTAPGAAAPYVGIDSYWDALLEPQWSYEDPNTSWAKLENYVSTVRANGQEPALYFQPFAHFWLEGLNEQIGGTKLCPTCPNQTLKQMALKVNGVPIQRDGAWALDPTNPGVLNRARLALTKFRELGVRYVKIDFMTHGTLEADGWYDTTARTGLQAFHKGMGQFMGYAGPDMFVDAAISPLFMAQYAQARRISCDAHGSMNNWHESEPDRYQKSTEYMLNSLTYGWWLDELYAYNDADHIQFGNYVYQNNNAQLIGVWPESYNRARVTSAVITGVYLISDDFSAGGNAELKVRAKKFLQNPQVNGIAQLGRSFRPVEADTGFKANNMYVLQDGGTTYLAVFNFDKTGARTFTVDAARLGLNPATTYTMTELWSGTSGTLRTSTPVSVPTEDAKIFKITG
ncbi:carbohydrate-binding protein [Longispora sp. NPDC051575]|uniref:carbohydrate-binding protein n=1 Tax=Longispora sp. NPDC051575 TaxID=3154943 RepID=UPI003426D1F9